MGLQDFDFIPLHVIKTIGMKNTNFDINNLLNDPKLAKYPRQANPLQAAPYEFRFQSINRGYLR
jgi:hypothetical protein